MEGKRIAFGVVLNAKLYESYGSRLRHAATFNCTKTTPDSYEWLWFLLGKRNMYVVVKNTSTTLIKNFITAGLLLDMTGTETVKGAEDLHSRIMYALTNKEEYVRRCNMLRNLLASSALYGFRYNGVEWESLVNEIIISRASILTGNFSDGIYWNGDGSRVNVAPIIGKEQYIISQIARCEELERGQAKLCTLMFGFAMTRDIIYVGGSPGEGWQRYLDENYHASTRVYVFDASRLFAGQHSDRITHLEHFVNKPDDIWDHIPIGEYDFIWDVRGDTNTAFSSSNGNNWDAVYAMILAEIEILNGIIIDQRWTRIVRANIKVKVQLINEYLFPSNVRFFMMPYAYHDSGVIKKELRAVYKNNGNYTYSKNLTLNASELVKQMQEVKDNLRESFNPVMVVNSLLMRLDMQNFITDLDNCEISCDINLFCINWNAHHDVIAYLDKIRDLGRHHLTSFFTSRWLNEGEYALDELDLVGHKQAIFDSRIFGIPKLAGLYFFSSELNLSWYKCELVMGETYQIMNEEMTLREESRISLYDQVRSDLCTNSGNIFYKFPNAYSVVKKIASPSGHAARMVSLSLRGEVSIGMFLWKIIYSFYKVHNSWVSRVGIDLDLNLILDIQLNLVQGHGEKNEKKLWHSYEEWILGLQTGYRIHDVQSLDKFHLILNPFIHKKSESGAEIKLLRSSLELAMPTYLVAANALRINFPDIEAHRDILFDAYSTGSNCDPIEFFVNRYVRSDVWHSLIYAFDLDKYIRELLIHKAVFLNLSKDTFQGHDSRLMLMKNLLLYSRYRITDDISYVYQMDNVLSFRFIDACYEFNDIDDEHMDEIVFTYLADYWIKDLPFQREISGSMLKRFDISTKFPLKFELHFKTRMNFLINDDDLFTSGHSVILLRKFSDKIY